MTSNLQSVRFGDLVSLIKNKYNPSEDEDLPYVGLEHIGQGTLQLSGIGSSTEVVSGKYRFQAGDVLYGKLRPYFHKVLNADFDGVCSTDIWVLRPKNSIDSEFFFYIVADPAFSDMTNMASEGTKMPRARWDFVSNQNICIPQIEEQRIIAYILGTLDEKIKINRQMNETLEEMARAIFKSWFIDFDPVYAKAEGRKPFGMDEETAELFPDEFEDSELGPIPKGWTIKPLDSIADFLNGLALQKYPPEDNGDNLPAIKIAELNNGITNKTSQANYNIPSQYIVENGDLLFSWSGSLVLKIWCDGRGALNQHLFKVSSKNFSFWFFYMWVNKHMDWFRDIAASKATTMGHINRGHLSEALTLVPSEALLKRLDKVFNPIISSIINNTIVNHTLSDIRDTLLPKLISGELKIDLEEWDSIVSIEVK